MMNDKSYSYLYLATDIVSSLLLDFDRSVCEYQHGSDHFPIVIESVVASIEDHNAKWK